MNAWVGLVNSIDEQIYEQQLKIFTGIYARYLTFQEYVYYTWLLHHKRRFVQAWTDHDMYLGNTTTNRYIFVIT